MLLDAEGRFSNAQAVTSSAVGSNVVSLVQARAIGNGEPIAVLFCVDVAADQTTGDEDYTFDVEASSAAAQNANVKLLGRRVFESGTPTAPAEDADLLVAGFKFAIVIPPIGASEDEIYLGIRYVTAGTSPTITMSAYLVPLSCIDASLQYPDGFLVS